MRALGRIWTRCSRCEEEPGLGNGGLGGWPPATWTRWPRSKSGDRLRHPLRVRHLRPGDPRRLAGGGHRQVAAQRQPVGDRAARTMQPPSASAATPRADRRAGPLARALDTARSGQGRGLRHADRWATASTLATSCGCGRAEAVESFDFEAFKLGDYYRAVAGEDDLREHHQGALSERRADAGQALRLEQQYFFVSCSLQDMLRLLRCRAANRRALRREVRGAAQRHAPGDRRRRADAPARGRAHVGWDEAWDVTRAHVRLHEPHAAARGARDLAAAAVRSAAAAACSRSSTRSIAASSTRSAQRFPATTRASRGMSLIDESRRQAGAHGAPRDRRQPRGQRRRRAAFRLLRRRCCATSPSCGPRGSPT